MQFDSLPSAALQWLDPMEAVRTYTQKHDAFALLLSGTRDAQGKQISYLALNPESINESGSFDEWRWRAHRHALPAFGFLGYECWQHMDALHSTMTAASASFVPLPLMWWLQPRSVLVFDHITEQLTCYGEIPIAFRQPQEPRSVPRVIALGSSLSKKRYMQAISQILEDIQTGEYYQANLTRKIYGLWHDAPSPLDIFANLRAVSPAPYSALLSNGEWAIASSSMEQLLKADADGTIQTRPIKGSVRRSSDTAEDAQLRESLTASTKDRAENLMIVDLMRNDIAQHCVPGSVEAPQLFALESYAQIHHLVSTITGKRADDASLTEIILSCMPPGSMTGAPKRAAIHRLAQLEPQTRGVYAGALGWVQHETCDLSVVIRTLVMRNNRFEFQVGGGIVADSDAENEWRESLIKARGIAQVLQITEPQLAAI